MMCSQAHPGQERKRIPASQGHFNCTMPFLSMAQASTHLIYKSGLQISHTHQRSHNQKTKYQRGRCCCYYIAIGVCCRDRHRDHVFVILAVYLFAIIIVATWTASSTARLLQSSLWSGCRCCICAAIKFAV